MSTPAGIGRPMDYIASCIYVLIVYVCRRKKEEYDMQYECEELLLLCCLAQSNVVSKVSMQHWDCNAPYVMRIIQKQSYD